ncbi:MAG: class I SAM-dependent methyltransferase [Myxococcota bacterium]|jgi:ubiquinone/menaquinone biosynthesis C-methylase UbiE|nr:class I SAM-dependent methyltransferase [Myxococcota bacterium]
MNDDKVACMKVAREYGFDYWDGDRRFGYGGYRYDGRWKPVAERIIEEYALPQRGARILDMGCGKAHLLYELDKLLEDAEVVGCDVSEHALEEVPVEIRSKCFLQRAQDPYPFVDDAFDLVISVGTLHNLTLPELSSALGEIERVGKQKFVLVESYRDEAELFNLQCWALTCESFLRPEEWRFAFDTFGYTGDYEFIYFED